MMKLLRHGYNAFRGIDPPERVVPAMDGPLHPNTALDDAPVLLEHEGIDNLVVTPDGLLCSTGRELLSLGENGGGLTAKPLRSFEVPITCIASDGAGGLVIGLDGKGFLIVGGEHDGLALEKANSTSFLCPTSAFFVDPHTLIVTLGSSTNPVAEWKRDLMSQQCSGSVWRIDLRRGADGSVELASGLAFPACAAQGEGGRIHVSEAWLHRVVNLDAARPSEPEEVLGDLPAYPGSIAPADGGGFWLALFAPRNPLIEFVIGEKRYCERMMETVDPDYWIAPALVSGKSFLEPIQGGARKKLNTLKPWSPSWSYGLVLRCGRDFRPLSSLHSRADGHVHGVTACCEAGGRLLVAASGSGCIVGIDPDADTGLGVAS